MRNVAPAIAATALALTTLAASGPALAVDKVYKTEKAEVRVTTFADGLTEPWGLAALPDGGFLVTEKKGIFTTLRRTANCRSRSRGFPRWTTGARAVCSTWRSTRSSSGTGWSISAIPNRAKAATDRRGAWRAQRRRPRIVRPAGDLRRSPRCAAPSTSAPGWSSTRKGTCSSALASGRRSSFSPRPRI